MEFSASRPHKPTTHLKTKIRGDGRVKMGVAKKNWPIQDIEGHFIAFSLCIFVARIDTVLLALAFVSYGFVLVRVRVRKMGSPIL